MGETLYERKTIRVRDGAELASVLMLFESNMETSPTSSKPVVRQRMKTGRAFGSTGSIRADGPFRGARGC